MGSFGQFGDPTTRTQSLGQSFRPATRTPSITSAGDLHGDEPDKVKRRRRETKCINVSSGYGEQSSRFLLAPVRVDGVCQRVKQVGEERPFVGEGGAPRELQ